MNGRYIAAQHIHTGYPLMPIYKLISSVCQFQCANICCSRVAQRSRSVRALLGHVLAVYVEMTVQSHRRVCAGCGLLCG